MGNSQSKKCHSNLLITEIDENKVLSIDLDMISFLWKEEKDNWMLKFFSIFKGKKQIFIHCSPQHLLLYQFYAKVIFPQYFPKFLDRQMEYLYKHLPEVAHHPKLFLEKLDDSLGSQ